MQFSNNHVSKIVLNLILFHFFTSQITMLLMLGLGTLLFLGISIFLTKNFVLGIGIPVALCMPGYIYIQWKLINCRYFKRKLKNNLNLEWTTEISDFFWKKVCFSWYGVIICSVGVLSFIGVLIHKAFCLPEHVLYNYIAVIPIFPILYSFYRYLTKELEAITEKSVA